jgi:hypothetical protein
MAIEIEQRIEELCKRAAKEPDPTKLKNLVGQLIECIDVRQQKREEAKKKSASGS